MYRYWCKHTEVVHATASRGPQIWFIGQNNDKKTDKISDWYHIKGMTFGCRMKWSTILLYSGLPVRGTNPVAWFVAMLKGSKSNPDSLMPFCSAHRGNHKVEDACEMYARAANMFKMAKNWSGRWHVCTYVCVSQALKFVHTQTWKDHINYISTCCHNSHKCSPDV